MNNYEKQTITDKNAKKLITSNIILICVIGVVLVAIIIAAVIFFIKYNNSKNDDNGSKVKVESGTNDTLLDDYLAPGENPVDKIIDAYDDVQSAMDEIVVDEDEYLFYDPTPQPETCVIPDYVGLDYHKVLDTLDLPIKFEVCQVESDMPINTIVDQVPAAGTETEIDTTVTIYVSAGTSVEIPDIIGFEYQAAISKLEELGMTFKIIYIPSEEVPANCVVKTDPGAYETIDKSDQLHVYISTGPSLIS